MYELLPVPPSPRCEPLLVYWYFDFLGVCVPGTTVPVVHTHHSSGY